MTDIRINVDTFTVAPIETTIITSANIADGTIVNADINNSAAISKTKIAGTAVTVADTGTVTSTMILDGTIVNADINASAAIAQSKISGLVADLGLKAPLADPIFTGDVVLPTTTTIGDVSGIELNVLSGVASTLTSAELNILDGVTANKDELNILDGALLSTTELNVLDGLTATTTQLNYVAGVTSAIQTQLNGKNALPVYKGNFPANQAELDFVTNDVVKLTISANTTVTSTVPTAGNRKTLIILTSGGTSRTVTFGAGFLATANLATGTVTGNHFVISFVSDGDKLIETSRTIAM
jgi:hypothetical protein